MRAWQTADKDAFVLHWVNYQQDEDTDIEVPIPAGTFLVDYTIPPGYNVDHIEWRYPEMREPVTLPHEVHGARVRFTIPGVIVYGLSVMYVAPKHIEDHP